MLSNGYYIDLVWSADRHYATDPWDKGVDQLPEAERARILGGEATMWSEFVGNETIDSRIWPRTAAIAERLWSPRAVKDVDDMYARLDAVSRWLEWIGLDHRAGYPRMLQRLAGRQDHELRRLADVVEPLEDYQRGETGDYTQQTPLNRLVDAARPESDAARAFSRQVDALLADPARQAGREAIRARLQEWQGLDVRLRPLLERNELLREAVPLAAEASALAAAGLEALGFLEQGVPAPASWWDARAPLLEREKKPVTALEVAYRPSVRRLMEAAVGPVAAAAPSGRRVPGRAEAPPRGSPCGPRAKRKEPSPAGADEGLAGARPGYRRLPPAVRPEPEAAPELVVVFDVVELAEERRATSGRRAATCRPS